MANPAANPWLGKKLSHFRIQTLAGKGAMGRVFLAEDENLQRRVALKVLPRVSIKGDASQKRVNLFIQEARSAAKLDHPNIVRVYEVGQAEGMYYIAMELVEGGNLDELVKAGGPLDTNHACQLAAEAAEALEFGHRCGVVHRDIKPANLMLTRDGRCKVTDFGLARLDSPEGIKLNTEAVGTPNYAAPEVSKGMAATAKSDQYSLGCTMWYLLTAKTVFEGSNPKEIAYKHVHEELPDIREFRPGLPDSLVNTIYKTLEKEPADRFPSCGQLAKVLRRHTIAMGDSDSSGIVAVVGDDVPLSGSSVGLGSQAGSGVMAPPNRTARSRDSAPPLGISVKGWVLLLLAALVTILVLVILMRGGESNETTPIDDTPKVIDGPKLPITEPEDTGDSEVSASADDTPQQPSDPEPEPESVKETPDDSQQPQPEASAGETDETPAQSDEPGDALPRGVYSVEDRETLTDLAAKNEQVVVQGRVKDVISTDGTMVIRFEGAEADNDFRAMYGNHRRFFQQMRVKFGGPQGQGMIGKIVRISGDLLLQEDAPVIEVSRIARIYIIPE